MKPLAVTGIGVVSPFGVGWEPFRAALSDPDSAAKRAFGGVSSVLEGEAEAGAVAEVWNFDASDTLGKKGLRNLDRLTRMLVVAARVGLEDAGIKKDGEFIALAPQRVGICSSTAYGSLDAITELNLVAELEDPRYINPARFPNTVINAAAGYVSIWEDLQAPNCTVVDGNCGALDALLTGETHLLHRRGDAFLVGGGESLSKPLFVAFDQLGAIPQGLRLGEGAAYLILERLSEARDRGARFRGVVAGYGTAFDPPASDALLVHASKDSVMRAVRAAIADAHLEAEQIDAVVAAQCGLEELDAAENDGLFEVLRPDTLVAAPKQLFGETLGGSGALGMAAALAWFDGAAPAPTLRGTLEKALEHVLVLTVGFYGNVSAVVLRSPLAPKN